MNVLRMPRPICVTRLFGIPLLLDWSWMPVIPLYSWAIAAVYLPYMVPGRSHLEYWGVGVLTTLLIIVSVVAHELAHALVARAEGLEILDITLFLFGGLARMASESPTPRADLKIAIVGPGMSFALGVIFIALDEIVLRTTPFHTLGYALYHVGTANLVLAMFNLLPGFPLDGGRALRAILWGRWNDAEAATRAARSAGRGIAWILVGVGCYVYIVQQDRMTGLWSVSVGVVLLRLLGMSDAKTARAAIMASGTVGDVMRYPPVTVGPDMTIQELLDVTLEEHRQASFLVARDGRLHGVVSLADIRDLPRDIWAETRVGASMRPVDDSFFVAPATPVAAATRQLEANGVGHLAVLDSDGIVIGSLDVKDLRVKG